MTYSEWQKTQQFAAEFKALVRKYMPKAPMNQREKKPHYPSWICADCGTNYGRPMPKGHVATWHKGVCGWCERSNVSVTEPRDFRYPTAIPLGDKMNRRGFLSSLLGLAAAPIAGVLPALAPRELVGWIPIAYYGVIRSGATKLWYDKGTRTIKFRRYTPYEIYKAPGTSS